MRFWVGAVCALIIAGCSEPVHASYELRGKKHFENTIDGHDCQELLLGGRSVAWVNSPVETSKGLIARICAEEDVPEWDTVSPGAVYGSVKDGWYVFSLATGAIEPLHLPSLGNYSNPVICDRLAAYWAVRVGTSSSLILADLESGDIVQEVPIGSLELETDYMYHLAPAAWAAEC